MTSSVVLAALAVAGASPGARSASTSPPKRARLAELAGEAATGREEDDRARHAAARVRGSSPPLPAELELVSTAARTVRFEAGQRLFHEGTPASGCWLIHDGCVALDLMVPGRGQIVVQTLGPGDVLGWSWLLPPYQWHFGAAAVRRRPPPSWIPASCAYSPTRTRGSATR